MQSNRDSGNFTPDGFPIAVPGSGSLGVPTVFAGTARDSRTSESMFRPDERQIVTEFNNLVIDTGTNFQVLDIAEAGELQSIVVVSDNPYLQVFVQIDDFRNAEPNGLTVAELLYNGNLTQLSQRRFRAVDGQSPTVGYAMVFEPQNPVQYTERIRIILYNNIPRNSGVYGQESDFPELSDTTNTRSTRTHGRFYLRTVFAFFRISQRVGASDDNTCWLTRLLLGQDVQRGSNQRADSVRNGAWL